MVATKMELVVEYATKIMDCVLARLDGLAMLVIKVNF